MINPMLSFMQLCDSNFPSGAFSHSFGLETYIFEGTIQDAPTFENAMRIYMKTQVAYTDGLACRLAYEYIEQSQQEKITELDHTLYALALAKETREGARRIGERMAKLCVDLYKSPLIDSYHQQIRRKEVNGHPSIVFALAAHHVRADKEDAVAAHIFSSVHSLIQNAVRAIPLGQTDGQRILLALQPLIQDITIQIEKLTEEELGMNMPGLEIAQMRHEQLPVRLFMS
ncbi:urease accessory protein UreF [Domibacillus antri]|uniref:Urease accessory protein UreF n=1 Tax=Domibacillus antri TaxID=1714264 RepID=A0A1Q8Q6Q3_9BACI|nr:urease accessory protein UreF [Domibacillus antri]OLN23026.1 urease accessory protein UreF [Domibacillus antri]